jgi:hypothetical protein
MHEPRDARQEGVAAVSAGLQVPGTQLLDSVEVEIAEELRNKRGWPVAILAARIADLDSQGEDIGAWAIGPEGAGPIFALDPSARQWTSWGDVEPGSRAGKLVERLAGYPETQAARDAVRDRRPRRSPRRRR